MKKIITSYLKSKQLGRISQHIVFWLFSGVILLKFFTSSSEIMRVDYIYTVLFLLTLMPCVYFNSVFLVPRFLQQSIYWAFIPAFIFNVAFFSWFNLLFFDKLIDYILPGYYFISYYSLVDISCFFLAFAGITTLLKMARSWFRLAETDRKLAQMQQLQTNTELNALKAQINPHFLFNSLNSIYSLILSKSDKAANAVLRLSDILRYTIYDAKDDFVPLKKELTYLTDYIELQRFRSKQEALISFKITGDSDGLMVAPLLFIPLVENAFKHGVKGDVQNAFVEIELNITNEILELKVRNNKGTDTGTAVAESNGVGLENVKRRLELIYPGNYQLNIAANEKEFNVTLTLKNISVTTEIN
ncbi:MAG: histidine kinase [Bacteroidetes bacterium]|nr:histidine kinase [Bacteroidota bacterium]